MPVDLTCRTVGGRPFAGALAADALALLATLSLEHCELSLVLTSDQAIRRLNREFRRADRPTDVLSFPQIEGGRGPEHADRTLSPERPPLALGDIVISVDTARRQARELGQAISTRIRTLLIHGMLHLLGYDHERSRAEARRMFAREHQLAALMEGGEAPRPRSPQSKPRSRTACPGAAADKRWSPAAMPERPAKQAKKSDARRTSGAMPET